MRNVADKVACVAAVRDAVTELGGDAPIIDLYDRAFERLDEMGYSTPEGELAEIEVWVDAALEKVMK